MNKLLKLLKKTQSNWSIKDPQNWLKFRQLLVVGLVFIQNQTLWANQELSISRAPASSYVQNDNTEAGTTQISLSQNFWEDPDGILKSMKDNYQQILDQEQFQSQWGIEPIGQQRKDDPQENQRYFRKMMAKYFNKKYFKPKIKRAGKYVEENIKEDVKEQQLKQQELQQEQFNDEMQIAAQKQQESVSPINKESQTDKNNKDLGIVDELIATQSTLKVSRTVRLKLRAKPIKKQMIFVLQNPYIDYETRLSPDEQTIITGREFIDLGLNAQFTYSQKRDEGSTVQANINKNIMPGLWTSVQYDKNNDTSIWQANIDKSITENLLARVSSSQDDNAMAFSSQSNRTVQLLFGKSF